MERVNLFFIILGVIFVVAVLRKTISRKMLERESLFWIFLAVLAIVLSIWPQSIQVISGLIGIEYAPSLLFLISILCLLYINMKQSIQISQLNAKIRELAQRTAIIESESTPGGKPKDEQENHDASGNSIS